MSARHTQTERKRSLAVEPHDIGFNRQPKSMIRIKGQWLKDAGFMPGSRVIVEVQSPGVMTLRLAGSEDSASDSFTITCQRLDAALAAAERS